MTNRTPLDLQVPFDRITYREGQLLASRDLQDDVRADQRLRALHTRYLHGTWGIALGFTVTGFAGSTSIRVGPGYAVDIMAREIVLAETLDLPAPNTEAAVNLVLVVGYQDDRAYRGRPDVAQVCGRGGLDPRNERPVFAWRTLEDLDLGADVPLARIAVQGGAMTAPPDPSVRRNASRIVRPYIAFDSVKVRPQSAGGFISDCQVDTSDAGFSRTPQYFARLNPADARTSELLVAFVNTLSYIDRPTATNFFYNVPLVASVFERGDLTLTWVGVEPITGCEPAASQFIFWLGGFIRTLLNTTVQQFSTISGAPR